MATLSGDDEMMYRPNTPPGKWVNGEWITISFVLPSGDDTMLGHPVSAEHLEKIKERCQKATASPWRAERRPFAIDVVGPSAEYSPTIVQMGCYPHNQCQLEADMRFITEARSDIPVLLAEVNRLRDEIKKLQSNPRDNQH